MKIRPATPEDIPRLCELLHVLFSQEAEFHPDNVAQAAGLRRIIADSDIGRILVAETDGTIVGMVNLLFTISTALGTPVANLEDVVVDPARRGHGIGSMLIDVAIATARAAGCRRVSLLTDSDNRAAQRLYARHGFMTSGMLTMRLLFPPKGD
jgi:ribosomal protein S18 acetylase RimI-like enzyme